MSTSMVYFLPSRIYKVGRFKKKVIRSLKEMLLIDGYYDKKEQQFASGLIPFEYASVHDNKFHKVIPGGAFADGGSICYNCHMEVGEALSNVVNDYYEYEYDTGKEKDMRGLEVVCPNCNTRQSIVQLSFGKPVVFANQYFEFVDINDDIDQKFVRILEEKLGCELKLVYERL